MPISQIFIHEWWALDTILHGFLTAFEHCLDAHMQTQLIASGSCFEAVTFR